MKTIVSSLLVLSLFLFAEPALARRSVRVTRVLPAGILFSPLNESALINASTLAVQKGRAARAAYGPRLNTADPFEGSFAVAGKKFGMGFGYVGTYDTSGVTHGAYVGAGLNLEPLAIGLGLYDGNVENTLDPDVDLSFNFQGLGGRGGKGLHLGMVIHRVNKAAQASLGIGFIKKKKYFLEGNVLLPPFSGFSAGGNYRLTVGAGVYVGPLGVSFRTRYHTSGNTYEHTLGANAWLLENLNIGAQFDTPNEFTGRVLLAF